MINTRMSTLLINFAAILLGILLTLAFAPYEIFPLAIFAPAGLLLLWLNVSAKKAFWRGFLFGLGFFGSGVWWVYISMHEYGDVPAILSIFFTCGFIATLALFPALVGYSLNRFFTHTHTTKILCAFPALWVYSEWIRSWIFTGFPWLFIGYSQTQTSLKGFAPILSVYGVSLAVLLSSALIVRAYLFIKNKQYQLGYWQLFFLLCLWLSATLLSFIPWTQEEGPALRVSLVQGNIPQQLKWSPEHIQLSLDRYWELTKPLWGQSQLIIWPEAAVPLLLQDAKDYIAALNRMAKKNNTQLLLGIPILTANNSYLNTIISVGDDQTYNKRHLVPFGEFTPLSTLGVKLFAFLNIPMADTVPGIMDQDPFIFNQIKIVPSICYEIAFPELIVTNDASIGILLSITNDAWFDQSAARSQHLQMAAMRAIELKRPLLFVANSGITAIISAAGNVVNQLPVDTTGVLTQNVQPRLGMTPWMKNRMAPLHIILLYLLYVAYRNNYPNTRKKNLNTVSKKNGRII